MTEENHQVNEADEVEMDPQNKESEIAAVPTRQDAGEVIEPAREARRSQDDRAGQEDEKSPSACL